MPKYAHLAEQKLDFEGIQARVNAMAMLGVPYGEAVRHAPDMARSQAKEIAARLVSQGGPEGTEDKKIIALIAYMQRMGTDISKPAPAPEAGQATASK